MLLPTIYLPLEPVLYYMICHSQFWIIQKLNTHKSVRINRTLVVKSHNIIDITWLQAISSACSDIQSGQVFRPIFLTGFFAFLRLSNIAPHSLRSFDPSRHLTGEDVFFSKKFVKILLKWSKTMQTRGKVVFLSLPKLSDHLICPFRALRSLFKAYPMSSETSLFQINSSQGSNPVTDSNVRKTLKNININLGSVQVFHFSRL